MIQERNAGSKIIVYVIISVFALLGLLGFFVYDIVNDGVADFAGSPKVCEGQRYTSYPRAFSQTSDLYIGRKGIGSNIRLGTLSNYDSTLILENFPNHYSFLKDEKPVNIDRLPEVQKCYPDLKIQFRRYTTKDEFGAYENCVFKKDIAGDFPFECIRDSIFKYDNGSSSLAGAPTGVFVDEQMPEFRFSYDPQIWTVNTKNTLIGQAERQSGLTGTGMYDGELQKSINIIGKNGYLQIDLATYGPSGVGIPNCYQTPASDIYMGVNFVGIIQKDSQDSRTIFVPRTWLLFKGQNGFDAAAKAATQYVAESDPSKFTYCDNSEVWPRLIRTPVVYTNPATEEKGKEIFVSLISTNNTEPASIISLLPILDSMSGIKY